MLEALVRQGLAQLDLQTSGSWKTTTSPFASSTFFKPAGVVAVITDDRTDHFSLRLDPSYAFHDVEVA